MRASLTLRRANRNNIYMPRYNSFGSYMKKLYGEHVHKVNIDAGFTCPNRDGTVAVGGCIYCNNDSFKPDACRPALTIEKQLENGITYVKRRYKARRFLAYFQPFTNTHAPVRKLEEIYREALKDPAVIGLAIGTRPDCIDEEKLDLIARLSKTHFVLLEYGLQSIYDRSLEFINRGHDYQTFLNAVKLTRKRGIRTGVHLIAGFPTETREQMLRMATELSETGIEFMKIHQLQIIKHTPLETLYRESPFNVFEYEEYLDFLIEFIELLSPDIVLQRLFATAPESILIAPIWNRPTSRVLMDIERKMKDKDTHQGKRHKTCTTIS